MNISRGSSSKKGSNRLILITEENTCPNSPAVSMLKNYKRSNIFLDGMKQKFPEEMERRRNASVEGRRMKSILRDNTKTRNFSSKEVRFRGKTSMVQTFYTEIVYNNNVNLRKPDKIFKKKLSKIRGNSCCILL